MGFMDWLLKGVDQTNVDEEQRTANFDKEDFESLKQISSIEMQESTTLNSLNHEHNQNLQTATYNQNNGSISSYNTQYMGQNNNQQYYDSYQNIPQNNQFNGYNQINQQNNFGAPLNTTQNVFMQQAPNQPFTQTTITIFQISSEDDIKFALKHLGKKSPCAISFGKMSRKKFNNLYQFLNGGVFALGAKIVKWNDNYILTPRGMEISKQDRSKR